MITLPELPPLDTKQSIPYGSIRYIPGYCETVVKEYATAYAHKAVEAERKACALACEQYASEVWDRYASNEEQSAAKCCAGRIRSRKEST